jgi:hypothetical protein
VKALGLPTRERSAGRRIGGPRHDGKSFLIPLLAAAAFFAASPSRAQITAFSAHPAIVRAGSLQTMRYVFVVGDGGFAKGGGIRIEIPVAYAETEFLFWSPPQTDLPDSPGYVWASLSNRARVIVRVEGLLRGIVEADFVDAVPPGTTVSLSYRGQVQAIAGDIDARFETRAHEGDNWTVGTKFPQVTVQPSRAQFVELHYPSDLVREKPFAVSIVALDQYGNLATDYVGTLQLRSTDPASLLPGQITLKQSDHGRVTIPGVVFRTKGFQKITATDPTKAVHATFKYAWVDDRGPPLNHLFGDTHFHTGTGAENRGFFANESGADVNTTGTSTFKALNLAGDHRANFTRATSAYEYARDVMGLDFASTSEHDAPLLTPKVWRQSQDVSDAFYAPGKFTTFYGFEWTPDLNHYVVLYKGRDGGVFDHDQYPDYPALVRALEAQHVPVLTIPHVSWPFTNHNIWRDSISTTYRRIGELYSLWNSRHLVQPDDDPQLFELSDEDQWSYQFAWKRGIRIGVIGSSDNHLGHPGANNNTVYVRHSGGLAVVLARANDREGVWDSMNNRATYATTGTQIYLDFSSDGHVMGSEYRALSPPHISARVAGTNRLASVELVKLANGKYSTILAISPDAETYVLDFVDTGFTSSSMYYLRIKQVDEYPDRLYAHSNAEMAWSSPIWVEKEQR